MSTITLVVFHHGLTAACYVSMGFDLRRWGDFIHSGIHIVLMQSSTLTVAVCIVHSLIH